MDENWFILPLIAYGLIYTLIHGSCEVFYPGLLTANIKALTLVFGDEIKKITLYFYILSTLLNIYATLNWHSFNQAC